MLPPPLALSHLYPPAPTRSRNNARSLCPIGAVCRSSNSRRVVNWNSFLAETKGAVPPQTTQSARKDSKVRLYVTLLCLS